MKHLSIIFLALCISGCKEKEKLFFNNDEINILNYSFIDENYYKFEDIKTVCIFGSKSILYNNINSCKNNGRNSIGLIDYNDNCEMYQLGNMIGRVGADEYDKMCGDTFSGIKLCVVDREGQKHLILSSKIGGSCNGAVDG